ncbi:MAG TPA: flagellar biosynthesis anti-sigma factor FlgM [Firmicutes bacterium]|jgi:anti-sigma28 factor (negative regulator of flagellin synthesis)|nr:flagellar biosynthesis anti-sigma factor FlgM [Bacillota bacterium]
MKITGSGPVEWQRIQDTYRRTQREPRAAAGDRAEISAQGRLLAKLHSEAMADGMRTEKTAALKAQIEAGTYHVSTDQLVAAIMKEIG